MITSAVAGTIAFPRETGMITGRELRGIIPPIVTPITNDNEVDAKGMARVVEHLLAGGVSGIFVCGSSGEFASMTFEDRRAAVKAAVVAVRRRVPVLAGCMATGLREGIQHAEAASAMGVDAVVVTPPFYFHYTQAEIVDFFRALARGVSIPIMAYNIPSTTHVSLAVTTALQISEINGVIGLKDSSGEAGPFGEILTGLKGRDDFAVFQGHERVAAATLLMGGHGCVLGLANAHPKLCVELYTAARNGDAARAFELQEKLNDLFNVFRVMDPSFATVSTVLAGMKTPLEILGLCSRRPYPPARAATAEQVREIRKILRRCGAVER